MTDEHPHLINQGLSTKGYVQQCEPAYQFVEDDYFNDAVLLDRLNPRELRGYLQARPSAATGLTESSISAQYRSL